MRGSVLLCGAVYTVQSIRMQRSTVVSALNASVDSLLASLSRDDASACTAVRVRAISLVSFSMRLICVARAHAGTHAGISARRHAADGWCGQVLDGCIPYRRPARSTGCVLGYMGGGGRALSAHL